MRKGISLFLIGIALLVGCDVQVTPAKKASAASVEERINRIYQFTCVHPVTGVTLYDKEHNLTELKEFQMGVNEMSLTFYAGSVEYVYGAICMKIFKSDHGTVKYVDGVPYEERKQTTNQTKQQVIINE